MSKMNGSGQKAQSGEGLKSTSATQVVTRKPPKNARVVKPSYKTGTISRAAARAAVKAVMDDR
jgi:hypothetical protein